MIETLPVHHLTRVVSLIQKGELVGFPTGTVYGLGVNALDTKALSILSAIKKREPEKTYSLLLPRDSMDTFVNLAPEEEAVLSALEGKPLTLLVRSKTPLKHLALDGKVGIRTADHPFTQQLVNEITIPITATSANKSGEKPARSVEEVRSAFPDADFMVVDGGVLPDRKPSTVVSWEKGSWKILRRGEVTESELKKAVPK